MTTWQIADDLKQLARAVINARDEVAHINPDDVLFLRQYEDIGGKALARCFSTVGHPIGYFERRKFIIVFYALRTDDLTPQQSALLILHELLHIPAIGDKLIDHDIKDFCRVLAAADYDYGWAEPGANVPDILKGE